MPSLTSRAVVTAFGALSLCAMVAGQPPGQDKDGAKKEFWELLPPPVRVAPGEGTAETNKETWELLPPPIRVKPPSIKVEGKNAPVLPPSVTKGKLPGKIIERPGVPVPSIPVDTKVEAKQQYTEEFRPSLKDVAKDVSGLVIYGLGASSFVKYEPGGIRITLPAGVPRGRPATGLITDFGVKGDFDITAGFELLNEPQAKGVSYSSNELRLVVVPNEPAEPNVWHQSNQNRASIGRSIPMAGISGSFVALSTKWKPEDIVQDQWGNRQFHKIEPTWSHSMAATAKTGQIRLVRSGAVLGYFVKDGEGKGFRQYYASEFGTKDLKNVRLVASTNGPTSQLDVRITDLTIRADGFVKETPTLPFVPEADPVSNYLWAAIVVPLAALSAALVAWLAMRRRDRAEAHVVSFFCTKCGARLKVKKAMAGGTVKCGKCGKMTDVPTGKPTAEDVR
jgi:hypothetical protein